MSIFEAFNELYPYDGNEEHWNYTRWLGNKYLNAAVHVWETGDYVGCSDLLWRWWNVGVITPRDVLIFAGIMETQSVDEATQGARNMCIDQMKKHANELISEEKRKNKTKELTL